MEFYFMSDETFIRSLRGVTGPGGISTEPCDLLIYGQDMWPRTTIQRAAGKLGEHKPDAVVWPESVEQLVEVVKLCRAKKVPFLPVAAGSGVIGGAIPLNGGVVIDVKRLNKLVSIDPVSMTAVIEAGMNGMHVEESLNERGYTLGHFPSSIMCSTAGGWAACRSAGQYSSKFGKIEDMIVSMDVVLPDGRLVEINANAAHRGAPDFAQLLIGSEGTLGIIVRVKVQLAPAPATRRFSAFKFSKMESGIEAMRLVMQAGIDPTMMRLYDPLDTLLNSLSGKKKAGTATGDDADNKVVSLVLKRLGLPDVKDFGHAVTGPLLGRILGHPALVFGVLTRLPLPSMLVMGFEGSEAETRRSLVRANELAQRAGGTPLGSEPGETWYKKRYAVSWKLSKVFSQGAFAETIEVAGLWKDVAAIYHAVHSTLMNRVAIMAHFSHAYNEGCACYFSLAGYASDTKSSLELYDWAVNNALDKAMKAGATVSHHHGVGLMKAAYLDREWKGGRRIFESLKDVMDPDRLMNPGKLFEALPAPRAAFRSDDCDAVSACALEDGQIVPESMEDVRLALLEAAACGRKFVRQSPADNPAACVPVSRAGASGGMAARGMPVRLNLARIDQILGIDIISHTVTVQAGLPMVLLENYLQEKGFTLGFVPRRLMAVNVGEYLAGVSPAAGSPKYRTVRQNCLGIDGFVADGTPFSVRSTPRRAAGPDLRHCFIGAGGVNGVIVSATLRIFPNPVVREAVAFGAEDTVAAVSAVRTLLLRGVKPEWALVVNRSPGEIGSRRASRLALQLGGDRETVAMELEIVRDVMGPLGLVQEPVHPDSRLQAPSELFECNEMFMEFGPLMTLLTEICKPALRRGPDVPELHMTHFSTSGATLRVLLRDPGQEVPAAYRLECQRRCSPVLKELGMALAGRLDPAGILNWEDRHNV